MKFVSKSSNLLVVLRPGLSAQPLTGTPAKPTVSVRFKDGVAEVPDGELTDMMLQHPGFNADFVSVETSAKDPFAASRTGLEPGHVLTEIKYGHPTYRQSSGAPGSLTPEMTAVVSTLASEMAKKMLKDVLSEYDLSKKNKEISAEPAVQKAEVKTKGKPGRPKKQKAPEPPVEEVKTEVQADI